ncbi:MAG TPA: heparan-alpha-glucosaminide N-acetyltransferase domain-containing protein [Ruania sp.]|nr:heparan-alpha-glucosaminide N-acetyltransferase domain-containing protein [Ruania sp.]
MQRIVGVDTARGLAILGMFVAHLGLVRDRDVLSPTGWFFIADGRPSALFALLAGVGLTFMTRRARWSGQPGEWRRQRVRIVKRAGVLYILGWVLTLLGTPVAVILPAYAVMFVFCLPFLHLSARTLLAWAAGIAAVMQVPVVLVRAQIGEGSPWRMVPGVGELLTGYYPALLWVAYLLVGLVVGRLDLRSRLSPVLLMGYGTAAAVLGYGTGRVLTLLVDPAPGSLAALLTSTEPHTDSALELVGNSGVAVAVIGLCLLVSRVQVGRLLLLPVSAAGAMALTVYSLHIVYIRILGSQAVWNPVSNLPLIWLVLGTLAAATVWQLLLGQGPFERALHALIRTAPDPAPWPHPEVSQRRR